MHLRKIFYLIFTLLSVTAGGIGVAQTQQNDPAPPAPVLAPAVDAVAPEVLPPPVILSVRQRVQAQAQTEEMAQQQAAGPCADGAAVECAYFNGPLNEEADPARTQMQQRTQAANGEGLSAEPIRQRLQDGSGAGQQYTFRHAEDGERPHLGFVDADGDGVCDFAGENGQGNCQSADGNCPMAQEQNQNGANGPANGHGNSQNSRNRNGGN